MKKKEEMSVDCIRILRQIGLDAISGKISEQCCTSYIRLDEAENETEEDS